MRKKGRGRSPAKLLAGRLSETASQGEVADGGGNPRPRPLSATRQGGGQPVSRSCSCCQFLEVSERYVAIRIQGNLYSPRRGYPVALPPLVDAFVTCTQSARNRNSAFPFFMILVHECIFGQFVQSVKRECCLPICLMRGDGRRAINLLLSKPRTGRSPVAISGPAAGSARESLKTQINQRLQLPPFLIWTICPFRVDLLDRMSHCSLTHK